jgi:hypothetical protein
LLSLVIRRIAPNGDSKLPGGWQFADRRPKKFFYYLTTVTIIDLPRK